MKAVRNTTQRYWEVELYFFQSLFFVVKLRPVTQINGNFALGGATLPICTQPLPPLLSSLRDPLYKPS